ncbi:LCP family protein [Scopulibacillus cellulosilyticus]|uniref:LCP family protein n=1 Tax=Scopulibacillus cellulosilyticus TaxID=2665665 RepID=A0ABW2PU16_9BACL
MRKAATIGAVILILLFFGTTGYAYYVYHSVHNTFQKINKPLKNKADKADIAKDIQTVKPISFLLLGVDERPGDSGRSDTMLVVTVNPKQKSAKILSIPRDTLTAIPGHGKQNKINAAYAYGGPDLSVHTVEHLFHIPIDYYIKINMDGLKDLINAVGGVTVQNDFAFNFNGYTFPKGKVQLNGDKALAYVKMRKQDPNGDLGRENRQQKVIEAVMKKEMNLSGLKSLPDVLQALQNNVKTNLTLNDMETIFQNDKSAMNQIQTLHLRGEGKTIDGVWYYDIPDEELNNVSDQLKNHLGIAKRDNQSEDQMSTISP